MILTKVRYRQLNWILKDLILGYSNLIVGKNSSGKSRVIFIIDSFAKVILQKKNFYWGSSELSFLNEKEEEIKYRIICKTFDKVYKEVITINNKLLLYRNEKICKIFSYKKNDFELINPPSDKLVLHVRRDIDEYPFLENIVNWANKTYGFKFGNVTPYSFIIDKDLDNLTSVEDIASLLYHLPEESKKLVVEEFNSLGYSIGKVYSKEKNEKNILYVYDKSVKTKLPQQSMSQGMFRSLALLIFIEYIIKRQSIQTLLIDDLCEGLDFDRATKLGKLVYYKCDKNKIQLIATSNDSFLMNVIDIEYWNILVRKDKEVKSFNYSNNNEIFQAFHFSGLSNFDFFASDFLDRKNKKI